jgi:biopolymer transport protein ExbD
MSHGSIEKCEPNLIPMLDLVLQMVMFFMLCANFIQDDLNEGVKLPHALAARPLDKSEEYVITLNIDKKGRVLFMKGNEAAVDAALQANPNDPRVLTNKFQVQSVMKVKYNADQARIEAAEKAGSKVKQRVSLIVIRAHENATYKMVNDVLEGCRMAGYADVQLRAQVGNINK